MKKFGLTLLTACVGGAIAIGGYKAIESKYNDSQSFEDKQKVYFTNNPIASKVMSSAGELDFTQAAASVTPAVVYIRTTYGSSQGSSSGSGSDLFEQFFGGRMRRQPQQARQASGSGVIISPDGYIVTNNHVVEKAEKIQVTTNDHRVMEAKVIGRDPKTDLALIKVSGTNLPIVKLGNSDDVRVGEWVLAVGNPFNLTSTVTAGIVSAKGRGIGILNQNQDDDEDANPFQPSRNVQPKANDAIESFIQTDAAINPGNSGGALVNTKGELIGINSAIASHTGSYEGYGFAVPVNLAKKVLNDIKQYGSVKRGYLGIGYFDLSDREQAQKAGISDKYVGLAVENVAKGSGAEAAGVQAGDILTKIDGNVIAAASDLTEHVGRLQPGDKVKLTATRNGAEKQFTVTLKENAGELTASANTGANADLFKKLGATFKPLTPAQKAQYKLQSGVIVTNITPGGILDDLEVAEGSVISGINRTMINSVEDIDRGLEAAKRRGMLTLSGIDPNGRAFTNTFSLR